MDVGIVIPTLNVLDVKHGGGNEILIILFEKCNLKCTFCHQDHNSMTGVDDIMSHATRIMNTYPREGSYNINISGGEIFLDELPDTIYETYAKLVTVLDEYFVDANFTFVTNLIFTKVHRVIGLVSGLKGNGVDVSIATSFDPVGRFNGKLRETFMVNVQLFRRWIRVITTVLTKKTVSWFVAEKISTEFEYLYLNFDLYFDHYTPDVKGCAQIPTDAAIADFYIYMADNFPDIQPLAGWLSNTSNGSTCRRTVVTNPTGQISTCRALPKESRNNDIISGALERDNSAVKFVEQYDCANCKHFHRCGMRCFLAHEYNAVKDPVCQYVRMFEHFTILAD